ncbi:MAG: hypothetical protein JNK48_02225, partial [Bryobacterales bacterium]|nr:hypothetical protein [Bryobacterales bacterium]
MERITEERLRVEALSRRVQDHVQKLSATNLTGEERAASGAIRQSMQAWLAAYSEYLQYTQSNKFDEAHTLATEKVLPAMQQAGDNAAKLAAGQQKALDAAALASQAEIVRSRTITAVFVAISLAMVIGMAILLNRLSSRLKESVEEIGGGVNAFRQVSRQISSSSQSLAQNANSQAASLTQSAAAAEQARRSSS